VVFCATVDHWHARVSVDSLNAGKHVYVEKPMSRYLGEAFEVYDAVKKTGKLLQVGSQGCSDQKWHKAAEWIKAGKIGPVVMLQGSYMRNTPKGEWNAGPCSIDPRCTPEDLNWKAWHGEQIKTHMEFSADDYYRWRKYYPFCAGLLSDLFPHKLHPYLLASANPEFPIRVASVGSKAFHTDKKTPGAPERDVPEIVQVIAEFPNGMTMNMCSSSVNEQGTQEMIRGHKGSLQLGSNRVQLSPERPFAEEIDPETSSEFPSESIPVHHTNLFSSIRGSATLNCPIDLAIRVQTIVSLAEMSERLGVVCFFDEKTRKVQIGDGTGGRKTIEPITYGTLPQS
jgi:predicted dehydrogenase